MIEVNKLTDILTEEVSFVAKGKNGKFIAISKSAEDANKELCGVLLVAQEGESELAESLLEKGDDTALAGVSLYRLLKGYADQLSSEDLEMVSAAAGYQPTETQTIEEDIMSENIEQPAVELSKEQTEAFERLSKELEAARQEAAEFAAALKTEKEARENEKIAKEAEAVGHAELAPVFKALDDEQKNTVVDIIKAYEAQIAELEKRACTEVGVENGADVSSDDELETAIVKEMSENKELSREEALQAVFNKDRALYKTYRQTALKV